MVLVGPALASGGTRSHLYDPGHFHEHRKVEDLARRAELKARDRALKAGATMSGATMSGATTSGATTSGPTASGAAPA